MRMEKVMGILAAAVMLLRPVEREATDTEG